MSVDYVDFHCHLDLYPDFESVFSECDHQAIHTLTVTTTPRAWPRNQELAKGTRHVRAALGFHPQLVAERPQELEIFEMYLSQARYIGEVGLDAGPGFSKSLDLQREVFQRILSLCSKFGGKILTIHSVRAATEVLNSIEKYLSHENNTIILHWFTGSRSEAQRAVDLGCYFSVNAQMLKNERHHNMIKSLPTDRILTETDGPFCQYRERSMRPADVAFTVELLAKTLFIPPELIAGCVIKNLRQIESFE